MRSFLTGLLALALGACGTTANSARPAMWKLSDPDTTIYLFGTVHVLPAGLEWRSKAFEQALGSADELVLEIADQGDKARVAATFRELAISPGLPPILERVPADQRPALAALARKIGVEPAMLDSLETWAAAVTLGAALYSDMGAKVENGVEQTLSTRAAARKTTIKGLETTAQQLGYFDQLPEDAQRELLRGVIAESSDSKAEFQKMVDAWARGDVAAIAATFDDELRENPELARVLLDERNANWTAWLKRRLDAPGTAFVAVGAGHLAGKGSVIEMLKADGLTVERVQ